MWSSNKIVAVVFLWSVAALADPTADDVEKAKDEFAEAMDLREKTDHEGALAHFRAAFALVPTPITGLEVGRTELQLGRLVAARDTLDAAAAMPSKAGESPKAKLSRVEARHLADAIRGRVAHLSVAPDDASDPAEITVDGRTFDREPRDIDPGHHVVVVRTAKRRGRQEIDLREGETRAVVVPTSSNEPVEETHTRFHLSPLFWGGAITAGAGLVVGSATGIAALAVTGNVSRECPMKQCPASARGDVNASQALGWISTAGFIVSGVGAAIAVTGFFVSFKKEQRTRFWLGPASAGIDGRFE
jgi:hypothetical protein